MMILILTLLASVPAWTDQPKEKRTISVSFDDLLVNGKYQFADESVTTVEQDKVLDAMLGVRKNFKDRLKKGAARY